MNARDIDSIVERIREDRRSGASELARQCLSALIDFAEASQGDDLPGFRDQILRLASGLQDARGSMAVIDNLMGAWRREFDASNVADTAALRDAARASAERLRGELAAAFESTADNMAALIDEGEVLMTHSLSSTIKALFARVADRHVQAIVTESRPLEEGRLMAQHLSDLEIETRYITDAQMGLWVGRSNRVVVGADAVLADGSVVNKAGTSLLAMAAQEAGVPFYVCCETFKYSSKGAAEIELEEMSEDELGFTPPSNVALANVYFDITPARYISAWVSEEGVATRWR